MAVLSIFGANPVRSGLDAAAVAAALQNVGFLVVSEIFMTETAQRASLVLPAAGAFEKSGTTTNLAGDLLPVNLSLDAPDFARSDLDIVRGLAEQLGVALPFEEELHSAVVAAVAAACDFTFGDQRLEFARDGIAGGTPPANGAARILSGGGTWLHDPWVAGLRS
jgi:predicted molibdopterin-dependent oxidoreductase YjgC